jgi:hypothetical protein
MKEVAIFYICTGNYYVFFKDFYKSSEKNFLPNTRKHYFVFTDNNSLIRKPNIEYIFIKKMGWPFDTLMRFNFFSKVIDRLPSFDFTFFFNANALIIKEIPDNILPITNDFIGALHPSLYDKPKSDFPYERNPVSTAFIDFKDGNHYFQGGLFGAKSQSFAKLIIDIKQNIEKDLSNDFIAIWHDESHLNRYFLGKNVEILDSSYIYPESFDNPYDNKIIMRDKGKFGHENFRNANPFLFYIKYNFFRIKNLLKLIKKRISLFII